MSLFPSTDQHSPGRYASISFRYVVEYTDDRLPFADWFHNGMRPRSRTLATLDHVEKLYTARHEFTFSGVIDVGVYQCIFRAHRDSYTELMFIRPQRLDTGKSM